ncbi:FHA domain-containing protein [Leisingera sp. HS039]|nr:FHA domain-containing protein [Leisingera sp. NJS201]MBQ4825870.1 FHA domain-containing protein [Leisingera sp. HS039]QBR34973.1 FHA domain-containing protein [Leisingera sp. NJS201]
MDSPADASIDVPAPSMGRGASRAGRVKTRLLGFSPAQTEDSDPFARSQKDTAPGYTRFPVGWLAIVQGPGRGAAFTLFSGVTVIGRGADQTVRLDFGDNSISRDNHAAIAYDPEQKAFYIGHGGKANLVRRNNRPVLSTETLSAGDVIRIGETTLRFVPLCGADFGWDQPQPSDTDHAVHR